MHRLLKNVIMLQIWRYSRADAVSCDSSLMKMKVDAVKMMCIA